MVSAGFKIIGAMLVITAISGCDTSKGVGRIFGGRVIDRGPDEFGIVPNKPLEIPQDLADLPKPTPGARNRTDLLPKHDAVAALGGNPARLDSTTVGAGEGPLLAAATRNGAAPSIRTTLAQEDAEFRKKNRPKFLQRIFKVDGYLQTYEDQTLPARTVNENLRRRGVKTPTVSPVEK